MILRAIEIKLNGTVDSRRYHESHQQMLHI